MSWLPEVCCSDDLLCPLPRLIACSIFVCCSDDQENCPLSRMIACSIFDCSFDDPENCPLSRIIACGIFDCSIADLSTVLSLLAIWFSGVTDRVSLLLIGGLTTVDFR